METSSTNISATGKFISVRKLTEELVAPLNPEDTVVQPVTDVSPPKWHLAHSTWFFENFLLRRDPAYIPFSPKYAFLFNSYYNHEGERVDRGARGLMTRPPLSEILEYRHFVTTRLLKKIEAGGLTEEEEGILELGIQHEQQHQELLVTDIKYILGTQPFFPAYHPARRPDNGTGLPVQWLSVGEGVYEIGSTGGGFSFDNEQGRHKVYLREFSIYSSPVTNQEWMTFMEDGGYRDFRHWLSDGWAWVNEMGVSSPMYWVKRDGIWMHYTLFGLEAVDPAAPVCHINYYEADAFARWSGCRLPTEQEWEVAANHFQQDPNPEGNWLDAGRLHPAISREQFDFSGNVWEWTASAYLPYPGFQVAPGALGEYNGKWMSGQMVLRGGSCATPFSHYRHSYRNFFPPDKRWQFSGLRLAK